MVFFLNRSQKCRSWVGGCLHSSTSPWSNPLSSFSTSIFNLFSFLFLSFLLLSLSQTPQREGREGREGGRNAVLYLTWHQIFSHHLLSPSNPLHTWDHGRNNRIAAQVCQESFLITWPCSSGRIQPGIGKPKGPFENSRSNQIAPRAGTWTCTDRPQYLQHTS